MSKKMKVKYFKSAIGGTKVQRACVRSLGFKRLNQTLELDDTPVFRGMINKVSHLVAVEEK